MTISTEKAIQNAAEMVANTREMNADKASWREAAIDSLYDDDHKATPELLDRVMSEAEDIWDGYRVDAGVTANR